MLVYRSAKHHVIVRESQDASGGLATVDALDIVDNLEQASHVRPHWW